MRTTLRSFNILSFIVCLTIVNVSFAQKQHEKKMYVDDDGNVYTQQSLPVQISIRSSEASSQKSIDLKEKKSNSVKPVIFPKSGVYTIPVTHGGTNAVQAEYEINVDGIAPQSKIVFSEAKKYKIEGKIYYGPNLKMELASEDEMSGLNSIFYALESGTFTKFDGKINLDVEKEYTIQYYALDNVGNVEEMNNVSIVVDKSSPETSLSVIGDKIDNVINSNTEFQLEGSDQLTGVKVTKFAIDDNPYQTYSGNISISDLSDGEHTLSYYSEDMVENKELVKKHVFFLDKISPYAKSNITGEKFQSNKLYLSKESTIDFSAVDNKAGVQTIFYSVNGGDPNEYEDQLGGLKKEGLTKVKYYAVDKLGNSSEDNAQEIEVYYDVQSPIMMVTYEGPKFFTRDTLYVGPKTSLVSKADDNESGVYSHSYKILNTASPISKEYKDPFQITKAGYHKIEFTSFDNVKNVAKKEVEIVVDNNGPELNYQLSLPKIGETQFDGIDYMVIQDYTKIYFSANDKLTGIDEIYYQINNGPEQIYSRPLGEFTKGDKLQITFRAEDLLGNSDTDTINIYIVE